MKTSKIIFYVLALSSFLLVKCNEPKEGATFRGNNCKTGIYESTEIAKPSLKWKCKLNGTAVSSPAVIDSSVYVGSGDNNLYAIDTKSGEVKWKFLTKGAVHSSPAVKNGTVYFLSMDGNFYAIDKTTGAEKWRFKTQGEKQFSALNLFGFDTDSVEAADPWDLYLSSPVVDKDRVYFGCGDSYMYALNANTGELAWKHKTGNVVHSSPAISNGTVYCGSYDSKLYALDAKTGAEKWTFSAKMDEKLHLMCGIQASPTVDKGVVYFGSRDSYVYAVNAENGELKWKQKFGSSWMPGSAAISDGKLFIGSSDAKKYFTINAENGEKMDSLMTHSFTFSSPAVSGNTVYIGVFNGFLLAIDKNNGKVKWTFKTDASKSAKYLNEDGSIKEELFEGITFKKHTDMSVFLERIFTLGSIASSPAVYNGSVYFTSADGYLYAIN